MPIADHYSPTGNAASTAGVTDHFADRQFESSAVTQSNASYIAAECTARCPINTQTANVTAGRTGPRHSQFAANTNSDATAAPATAPNREREWANAIGDCDADIHRFIAIESDPAEFAGNESADQQSVESVARAHVSSAAATGRRHQ